MSWVNGESTPEVRFHWVNAALGVVSLPHPQAMPYSQPPATGACRGYMSNIFVNAVSR